MHAGYVSGTMLGAKDRGRYVLASALMELTDYKESHINLLNSDNYITVSYR